MKYRSLFSRRFRSINIDSYNKYNSTYAPRYEESLMDIKIRMAKTRKKVTIYTDGSCLGNPGPGGWGAVLIYGEHIKEVHGPLRDTTNNRSELKAVIEAIKALTKPCHIDIYTDSNYICSTMNKGWKMSKNVDLWDEVAIARTQGNHTIQYTWVKAHAGTEHNERANYLAQTDASTIAETLKQERISNEFNLRERL